MFYNISIIIPFFNASRFIKTSLKNAKDITKKANAEVIYVDNNSNDSSAKILKKKIKNEKKISLFRTLRSQGKGPGVARNLGIIKSKGKYILFLDVDDKLDAQKMGLLENFLKFKNPNLVYLNRKLTNNKGSKEKLSPFLKYNRKTISDFFKKSNNMNVIFILFKKEFIKKNTLKFNKGIHEDIFFVFKSHFFNKKKISLFEPIIYLKMNYKGSITHSKLTFSHLNGMYCAWQNIDNFLIKKLSKISYQKIFNAIQFRWRGELANEYQKIIKSKLNEEKKKDFLEFIIKKYKKNIQLNYKEKTKKDKIVSKIL
tara:strand:+ start:10488 stop:11426 length:939 start_codon:yes stop_codon:yes gene_type:complete